MAGDRVTFSGWLMRNGYRDAMLNHEFMERVTTARDLGLFNPFSDHRIEIGSDR